jgi:hypothetical protein
MLGAAILVWLVLWLTLLVPPVPSEATGTRRGRRARTLRTPSP